MRDKPEFTRFFFAIDPIPSLKNQIHDIVQHSLKKKFALYSIEWIKKEIFHITLQFLKQINPKDIPKMIENVTNELQSTKSFYLNLGQVEFFPSPQQQRIITVHIEPATILKELSTKIGLGIKATGYPLELRPFKEHLTLGRIKQPQQQKLNLGNLLTPRLEQMLVKEIVLFKSQPSSSGSQYISIARIPLP